MSTLYIVRHGQASFGKADYDKLSELGERQCRLLGDYWASRGVRLDALYSGTLDRQLKSAEQVCKAYTDAGLEIPDPVVMREFNEYDTQSILTGSIPEVLARHPDIAALAKELSPDGKPDLANNKKAFQRVFSRVMDLWIKEELKAEGMETWREFTTRVNSGLERIIEENSTGRVAAIFTSGGPVSAVMQKALGISDKVALELGWMVINSSVSEFRFTRDRFSLVTFNETPHLADPGLISHR